jgi:Asp-tRNA(Asn)/Glu-tRNA(Gln) amidotransferase A subunit family amidase
MGIELLPAGDPCRTHRRRTRPLALSPDGKRYVSVPSDTPTPLPPPGLPFSLVFRAEPGKEDVVLRIAAAYEAASQRRIPPPAFGRRSSVELTLS